MARLTIEAFRRRFEGEVFARKIDWQVVGFCAADGKIFPLGTDTKVLSTVFESFCAPLIMDIAKEFKHVVTFSKQTVYPDFTLTPEGRDTDRIAIDVKTTYRARSGKPIKFTLGSYTSFLRDGKKNIAFPYAQYSKHWVIGFVYERTKCIPAKVYDQKKKPSDLVCPYSNVQFFIQEKHKIAGKVPGSGNTANIGSFSTTSIEDFIMGRGPFAVGGKTEFENYWRQYGTN